MTKPGFIGRGAFLLSTGLLLGCMTLLAEPTATARAGTLLAQATPIQSQDSNIANVVADLTECKRKDGVLTIKVRFRNTGDSKAEFNVVDGRNFDADYVTAGDKKYFILEDSEKVPLAPQTDGFGAIRVRLEKGASYTWWAKYPAPPADVKSIIYYMAVTPPFEDVPITD
jgi:hypothetical protein